jgi:predicted DNA-binding antitoxin AbrB/MazE fold protein
MDQTITAIYENGVLRPLTPLELPEHTAVEVAVRRLPSPTTATAQRRHTREVLIAAGLVLPESDASPAVQPLSAAERQALARHLPAGRPLSEIIIEEREGR